MSEVAVEVSFCAAPWVRKFPGDDLRGTVRHNARNRVRTKAAQTQVDFDHSPLAFSTLEKQFLLNLEESKSKFLSV